MTTQAGKQHGVFYYVFWGVVSLLVTIFILGVGCLFLGVSFIATTKHPQSANAPQSTPSASPSEASNGVASNAVEVQTQEDIKAEYVRKFIQVSEFHAYPTYAGRQAGVTFRVRNAGALTVTRLEM